MEYKVLVFTFYKDADVIWNFVIFYQYFDKNTDLISFKDLKNKLLYYYYMV